MDSMIVIHNRGAGGADADVLDEIVASLRRGADVVTAEIDDPRRLRRVLEDHQDRRPVIIGGDGSVHAVVAALHGLGRLGARVIGLIPLGTGNDFARSIGVPVDSPANAAEIVVKGVERRTDLLVDDGGGVVVNAVHLGVGAEAGQRAGPLKRGLGRLAYGVGALLAGLRGRAWRIRVEVDGTTVADGTRRVLMVGVSNGRTIGGGTPLAPGARPDDGLADVTVSFAIGLPARIGYAIRMRRGDHPSRRDVTVVRGRVVRISGDPVPVNTDGEIEAGITERTWTVRPGAIRITVAP